MNCEVFYVLEIVYITREFSVPWKDFAKKPFENGNCLFPPFICFLSSRSLSFEILHWLLVYSGLLRLLEPILITYIFLMYVHFVWNFKLSGKNNVTCIFLYFSQMSSIFIIMILSVVYFPFFLDQICNFFSQNKLRFYWSSVLWLFCLLSCFQWLFEVCIFGMCPIPLSVCCSWPRTPSPLALYSIFFFLHFVNIRRHSVRQCLFLYSNTEASSNPFSS